MDGKGIDVVRTRRVYKFDELDARGRREALETVAKWLADTLDPDILDEGIRQIVGELLSPGVDDEYHVGLLADITVRWSLSYCQGDGVALSGRLEREPFSSLTWPDGVTSVTFRHSGRYTHEQSFDITYHVANEGWSDWDYATSTGTSVAFCIDFPQADYSDPDTRAEFRRQCEVFDTQIRHLCRAATDKAYAWMDSQSDESAAEAYLRETHEPYQFDANGYREPYYWWSDTPNPTDEDGPR